MGALVALRDESGIWPTGEPFVFADKFAAAYCGLSYQQVRTARKALLAAGILRRVGKHERATLYRLAAQDAQVSSGSTPAASRAARAWAVHRAASNPSMVTEIVSRSTHVASTRKRSRSPVVKTLTVASSGPRGTIERNGAGAEVSQPARSTVPVTPSTVPPGWTIPNRYEPDVIVPIRRVVCVPRDQRLMGAAVPLNQDGEEMPF